MANFTAGTSFTDGVTNDVTAAKLNALVADAVPTSSLALASTTGTISNFTTSTATVSGPITASTAVINVGSGQIYKDSSGNVGIGTASPTNKLHIVNSGAGALALQTSAASSDQTQITFVGTTGNKWAIGNNAATGGTGTNFDIYDLASSANRLRIDSSGNVGIGNSSPAAKLDVSGGISSTGDFTMANATALLFKESGGSPRNTLRMTSGNLIQVGDIPNAGNSLEVLSFGAINTKINTSTITSVSSVGLAVTGALSNTTGANFATSSGNVGVGTASPATKLHVDGTIRYTNRPAAGTITALGFDANGDLKASSSSLRYKHDVQDYEKGISHLMQLRPVSFKFNGETRKNAGFIAEEVNQLGLDEVMLYDGENRPDGIIYTNMISLLTKSLQELKAENDSLKDRVTALEAA
jgi:hypothetical protein